MKIKRMRHGTADGLAESFGMPGRKRPAEVSDEDAGRLAEKLRRERVLEILDEAADGFFARRLKAICPSGDLKYYTIPVFAVRDPEPGPGAPEFRFTPFMEMHRDGGGYTVRMKIGAAPHYDEYSIPNNVNLACLAELLFTRMEEAVAAKLQTRVRITCELNEYRNGDPYPYCFADGFLRFSNNDGEPAGEHAGKICIEHMTPVSVGELLEDRQPLGRCIETTMPGDGVLDAMRLRFDPLEVYRRFMTDRIAGGPAADCGVIINFGNRSRLAVPVFIEAMSRGGEELCSGPYKFVAVNLRHSSESTEIERGTDLDFSLLSRRRLPVSVLFDQDTFTAPADGHVKNRASQPWRKWTPGNFKEMFGWDICEEDFSRLMSLLKSVRPALDRYYFMAYPAEMKIEFTEKPMSGETRGCCYTWRAGKPGKSSGEIPVLDEAFGMPAGKPGADSADTGADYPDIQKNIVGKYLNDEILDTADDAAKGFMAAHGSEGLPFACCCVPCGKVLKFCDCTFKPFMELEPGGRTIIFKALKLSRANAVYVSEIAGMDRLFLHIEGRIKERLGLDVILKCGNARLSDGHGFGFDYVRPRAADPGLGMIRAVTVETPERLQEIGGFLEPENYPATCDGYDPFSDAVGFRLYYDSGGSLKNYKDIVSRRIVNSGGTVQETTAMLCTERGDEYRRLFRAMLGELSEMDTDELLLPPHRFMYIDFTSPYKEADFRFIKERRLPLKVITDWGFFKIGNSFVSYRSRIESVFGIRLSPDEYTALCEFGDCARGRLGMRVDPYVIVDPVEESFTFSSNYNNIGHLGDLPKWTKGYAEGDGTGDIDEGFSMPVRRSSAGGQDEPEFVGRLKADAVLDAMDEAACGFLIGLAADGHPYVGTGDTGTPLIAIKDYGGGKYPFTFRPFMSVTEEDGLHTVVLKVMQQAQISPGMLYAVEKMFGSMEAAAGRFGVRARVMCECIVCPDTCRVSCDKENRVFVADCGDDPDCVSSMLERLEPAARFVLRQYNYKAGYNGVVIDYPDVREAPLDSIAAGGFNVIKFCSDFIAGRFVTPQSFAGETVVVSCNYCNVDGPAVLQCAARDISEICAGPVFGTDNLAGVIIDMLAAKRNNLSGRDIYADISRLDFSFAVNSETPVSVRFESDTLISSDPREVWAKDDINRMFGWRITDSEYENLILTARGFMKYFMTCTAKPADGTITFMPTDGSSKTWRTENIGKH